MRGVRSKTRTAVVLAAALSAVGMASAAVAAPTAATAATVADSIVEQPFVADSGDSCQYGYSRGVLGWHLGPLVTRVNVVDVKGGLLDRPMDGGPVQACRDDRRFSSVTFTAYVGRTVADRELVRADNGAVTFGFQLVNTTSTARIDRVTVQVCRHSLGSPFDYCGPEQAYPAPVN